jgi:hypothetical protein
MHVRNCLAFTILLLCAVTPAWAQTIPQEYDQLIKNQGEVTAFGNEAFGDKVDIGTGSLEIVQTDVNLPGNNALPMRVGRRFVAGDKYSGWFFGDWSLDIPYMHGIFGNKPFYGNPVGWAVDGIGADQYKRCSGFSAPPELHFQLGVFSPDEYWHGSFFYLPGAGDHELLVGGHVPTDGNVYPIVTKAGAAVRCVALATTSETGSQGEGFEVVTPDGMIYTLNQMVSNTNATISKPIGQMALMTTGESSKQAKTSRQAKTGPIIEPQAVTTFTLPRLEVFLYPTKIADRLGNSMTFAWSPTNPRQLLQMSASDGRQITFTYVSGVLNVSDGSRTWTYSRSGSIDTVTNPDGSFWSSNLSALLNYTLHTGGDECVSDPEYLPSTPPVATGSVTSPSGASATYTMTAVKMGRSWVPLSCVTDDSGTPIYAAEPKTFFKLVLTAKKITGPGLPAAGNQWTYAYGPGNGCWYPGTSGCNASSPVTRTVSVTDPDSSVTRYTFGNHFTVDEGLLLKTESGWNGTTALRTVETTYGVMNAAPYGGDTWSVRSRGDAIIAGLKHPKRKVVTTQQGRTFTWEVAADCSGVPYCFDAFARPTKVIESSVNP